LLQKCFKIEKILRLGRRYLPRLSSPNASASGFLAELLLAIAMRQTAILDALGSTRFAHRRSVS
jgi:hypothetical protein